MTNVKYTNDEGACVAISSFGLLDSSFVIRISSFTLSRCFPGFRIIASRSSSPRWPECRTRVSGQLCKARGADVLTTEFVSSEGIFRRNDRTREYLDFDEVERPIGVQLFGGDPAHMAEAARQVIDWVQPDFIDLNFGCPVNKVVSKNGGSALLKDCPALSAVADAVVRAVTPVPVTAKIRIGWDATSINAPRVARILEDCGIAAIAVHGRTRAQGYSETRRLERDWRSRRSGHDSGRGQRRPGDCG